MNEELAKGIDFETGEIVSLLDVHAPMEQRIEIAPDVIGRIDDYIDRTAQKIKSLQLYKSKAKEVKDVIKESFANELEHKTHEGKLQADSVLAYRKKVVSEIPKEWAERYSLTVNGLSPEQRDTIKAFIDEYLEEWQKESVVSKKEIANKHYTKTELQTIERYTTVFKTSVSVPLKQ